MKLSEVQQQLASLEKVNFQLEDGTPVPAHFHLTEIGLLTKNFIDCGGVIREEKTIQLQLWYNNATDHRLSAEKFAHILRMSEEKLSLEDLAVEVEFQRDTIGRYDLEFSDATFILRSKKTACLAEQACGIPGEKKKIDL